MEIRASLFVCHLEGGTVRKQYYAFIPLSVRQSWIASVPRRITRKWDLKFQEHDLAQVQLGTFDHGIVIVDHFALQTPKPSMGVVDITVRPNVFGRIQVMKGILSLRKIEELEIGEDSTLTDENVVQKTVLKLEFVEELKLSCGIETAEATQILHVGGKRLHVRYFLRIVLFGIVDGQETEFPSFEVPVILLNWKAEQGEARGVEWQSPMRPAA
jgi:hypothetical protein